MVFLGGKHTLCVVVVVVVVSNGVRLLTNPSLEIVMTVLFSWVEKSSTLCEFTPICMVLCCLVMVSGLVLEFIESVKRWQRRKVSC